MFRSPRPSRCHVPPLLTLPSTINTYILPSPMSPYSHSRQQPIPRPALPMSPTHTPINNQHVHPPIVLVPYLQSQQQPTPDTSPCPLLPLPPTVNQHISRSSQHPYCLLVLVSHHHLDLRPLLTLLSSTPCCP